MELPEMSLIVAFESVARLRSFTRAAHELHITASAVSHRIRTLESVVGHQLLIRSTRHVELSATGREFLPAAIRSIEALTVGCDALRPSRPEVVTIATTDSVATCWLIERLPAITAHDPAIEVRVLTTPAGVVFEPSVAELGIDYLNRSGPASGDALLLATESIIAVASPNRAKQLARKSAIWSMPLLSDDNLITDWPEFATHAGAPPEIARRLRPTMHFNHSHLALRAAASGHGVALASSPLATDAIHRGELIQAIDHEVDTGHGYYLVRSNPRDSPASRAVYRAFQHHLGHPDDDTQT